MATDFQLIEAHSVDIETFSYDVSNMVDSIYIGPQGELLEKLEHFNHNYECNIKVTKSFTLKPGGYDEIKKAFNRWVLRYDLKPRGIKSLFDRIQQYDWRLANFKRDILDIETRMKNLKHSGIRWQDNTDQFEEEFDRLKVSIINSLDQTREMYPNVDISCKVIPVSEGRMQQHRRRGYYGDRGTFPSNMFSENVVDFVIMLYVKIQNATMSVHIMDDDGNAEYTMPMDDVIIASGTYLLPLISRHWGRTTPHTGNAGLNQYSFFLEAVYLTKMGRSQHPYIGRASDIYNWKLGGRLHSGNICTGNMAGDIRNSLINNEMMAHIVQLITWVTTYYVPQTNPLNRINRMRNFGDDIKFIQWRNDLNSTSSSIFRGAEQDLPRDCSWGQVLLSNVMAYATNEDQNSMYGDRNLRFNEGDVEWPMRIHEYLNTIELDDMPCNNCSFKSECNQWDVLQLIFKDNLTYEEESCFGMLYEVHEFFRNIINRTDSGDHREVQYVEMVMEEAWRWKLDEEYLRMSMIHKMCVWWAYVNDETFNTSGNRYRSRMKAIWEMRDDRLKHLFKNHYLNDESEFCWTLDHIKAYRHKISADARLDENQRNDEADTVVEERLPFGEPIPAVNRGFDPQHIANEVDENMTPEQRAIQWAIANGGAQNL